MVSSWNFQLNFLLENVYIENSTPLIIISVIKSMISRGKNKSKTMVITKPLNYISYMQKSHPTSSVHTRPTQYYISYILSKIDCYFSLGESPLMTSDIRVGRGSKIAPKMGRYRLGQGS